MLRKKSSTVEPYWFAIGLLTIVGAAVFLYHLTTGYTPGRVAFTVPLLELDVYWYGIIIISGIMLGAWVVSRLAYRRALVAFNKQVPAAVQARPVADLNLPEEIPEILAKEKVTTYGELLLGLGFGPEAVGLNRTGAETVRETLARESDVSQVWLDEPAWSRWNPAHVWNGLIWCLILAVIGARLYHVLTPSPSMAAVGIESPLDYLRNPLQMINLRRGGLGIYGGIAGGGVGLLIYGYRNRLPVLAWADLAAVGLALGQFVGRWANFVNQELYGRPTSLPWAISIEPRHRLPEYATFERFHPAFLYESLWNFFTFLLLLGVLKRRGKKLRAGELMALYLILYGIGRILMETVRLDSASLMIGPLEIGVPVATAVSAVVALVMAGWLLWRRRSPGLS